MGPPGARYPLGRLGVSVVRGAARGAEQRSVWRTDPLATHATSAATVPHPVPCTALRAIAPWEVRAADSLVGLPSQKHACLRVGMPAVWMAIGSGSDA